MGWFKETESLSFELWEQRLALEALRRTQGDVPAAAELMGISRASLYEKIRNGLIKSENATRPVEE
jgi:transcriptional regulator with PAS, ATPase and Fis domain